MRVIRKLLVPTLIFIGLIITGLIAFNTINAVQNTNEAEQERLANMSEAFQERLNNQEDFAVALAIKTANNAEVAEAFAKRDRERLIELTLPSYEEIDELFDVPQHQFHLAPATSFLRLHNIEKYGDDLSSFRFTVLAANAEKKIVSGLEIGRGGLGVRGVVPVTYENKHIGTVEFGTNVDLAFLEDLQESFGYDWQLFLSRGPAETATFVGAVEGIENAHNDLLLQASTLATPFFATENNYEKALTGENSLEQVSVDELEYSIYSTPLYDFSGNVIGVVDIISDRSAIVIQQRNQLLLSLGILLLSLLVIGFGFSFIANRTLRPIGELSNTASAIAEGDFSQRAKVESDDEIGSLAKVFNRMAEQLQGLFGTLEERVENATQSLTLAAEVGQKVSLVQDEDLMLAEAASIIRDRFDMYYTQIYLTDRAERNLILRAGTGQVGGKLLNRGHRLPVDMSSINGTAATQRKAVIVENTETSRIHRPNPLLPDTRSEMAVPLIAQDRVVGVLDLQSAKAGALNEENLPAFEALAGQLAIAIINVELFAEVEKARTQIEARTAQATEKGWRDYLDALERKDRIAYSYENENITPLVGALEKPSNENTMSVPIEVAGADVGTLQFEGKQAWDKDDAKMVSAIAKQVAQQIENIRLLEQSQQYHNEAQEALRRLTREGWDEYQKEGSLAYLYKDAQVQEFDEDFEEKQSYDIKISNEAIGQISIASHETLSAEDAEIVTTITEQLGAQLEKLRLSSATEKALSETESLYTASRSITAAQDTKEVAETLVAHIDRQKLDRVLVALIDDKEKEMLKADVLALWDRAGVLEAGNSFTDKQIPLLNTLGTQDSLFIDDFANAEKVDDVSKATFAYLGVKSAAIIPISVGETLLGWLLLETTDNLRNFSTEDMSSFNTLAGQVAVVLESQRLFDQTQTRAVELATVAEVSTAAARALNMDDLLQGVVDLTRKRFDLYHSHIFLIDDDGKNLQVSACGWEEGSEQMGTHGDTTIPLDSEQSIIAEVARTRQAVVVNDVRDDPRWLPNELMPNTRSEMAVPLIVGENLIGVFDIQSDQVNRFTSEAVDVQTTLAAQVATALQNARLYQESQNRAQREEALGAITAAVRASSNPQTILKTAVRELGNIFGRQASIHLAGTETSVEQESVD